MPRRLRLLDDGQAITGVVQKPWGTNYEAWRHPLSPYYDHKGDKLPVHPKPGPFGYRNWRGIILEVEGALKPSMLARFNDLRRGGTCRLLVAGWAMSNMSPLDFLWSEQPVFPLAPDTERFAGNMVEAAEQAGFLLASCTAAARSESDLRAGAGERVRQGFFFDTQAAFEARLAAMGDGVPEGAAEGWLADMRRAALPLFDAEVLEGLPDLPPQRQQHAAAARSRLIAAFAGGK